MKHDENTKAKIIEVAIECFGELGYEGTSMRLIAEKSGISKPAIYYYFPDKERLFCGIVEFVTNKFDLILENIKKSKKNPQEKLKDFMLSGFQPFKNSIPIRRFMNRLFTGGIKVNIPFDHQTIFKRQQELLQEIIQQGINDGIFRKDIDVRVFLYSLTGTMMLFSKDHFIEGTPPLTENQADQILKQFIEGVGAHN